jgi:tryptophan synthase alpha chain
MPRIADTFKRLKADNAAAFMPFIAAGIPDLDASMRLVIDAARLGADLIELGIPYSDPIADGPVIQSAFTHALERGLTVPAVFDAFARARPQIPAPVLAMVSYSIIRRMGDGQFIDRAAAAGFDGLIVPDLPPEDGAPFYDAAEKKGMDAVLLAAPTTAPDRRDRILKRTRGFLYYVSVAGITGARDRLPEDMERQVRDLKSRSAAPVCLGFGVGDPEQAAAVARVADGVIVGSAIVKRVDKAGAGPMAPVLDFIAQLARAVHGARKS